MCGITGYISVDGTFNPSLFQRATDIISHRGPDSQGYFCATKDNIHASTGEGFSCQFEPSTVRAALGFRRLSIVDLSKIGDQPMCDQSRSLWIVFNGEIYNYLELREQLETLGYRFVSNTDTEVILSAYHEWGTACLEKLNGMWAFAIVDTRNKEVFCARDRFGIKPFNYYFDGRKFVFGSEVKQVLNLVPGNGVENESSIFDFLVFGAKNHSTNTFYKNIQELRGGEAIRLKFGDSERLKLNKWQWWDIAYEPYVGSIDEASEEFLELLSDSIRIRLRSDVPVGTALSGGLDSAAIVSLIDGLSSDTQNTFTVYSDNEQFNELPAAELVINKFDTNSHPIKYGIQNIELMEKMTSHHDQPLNSAKNIAGWILYEGVKARGITVNLNGQGADELMSGYSLPPHSLAVLSNFRSMNFKHAFADSVAGFRNSPNSLNRTLRIFLVDAIKLCVGESGYRYNSKKYKSLFETNRFESHISNSKFLQSMREGKKFDEIQKDIVYRQLKTTVIPGLLHNIDRDSTAHSLEARVPFLDYRLAQFLFNMPVKFHLANGYSKYLFRRSVDEIVPREIVWNNAKKGFSMPTNKYLETGKSYISSLIEESDGGGILNITEFRRSESSLRKNNTGLYWRYICILMWMRQNKDLLN